MNDIQKFPVKKLHSDLGRKYRIYAAKVESLWRSFSVDQRMSCLKSVSIDGRVLEDPLDSALGNVCKIIPEWNMRDIAKSGPDFLLGLLEHRATKSLYSQYRAGINDGQGDYAFTDEMVRRHGHHHPQDSDDCFTLFLDNDERYGLSYRILNDESWASVKPYIQGGFCVPKPIGELILLRQIYLLRCLHAIIERVLTEGSRIEDGKERPENSGKMALDSAFSELAIQAPPIQDQGKQVAKRQGPSEWIPIPVSALPPPEKPMERRKKEKTRPPQPCPEEVPPRNEAPLPEGEPTIPIPQCFKVSSSAADTFSRLFAKAKSRGSIPWIAFEAAMVELGFAVVPSTGSVYTFTPSEGMVIKRPFTVHRPHKPRIEGARISILARRLARVYGWGEGTFKIE